MGEQATGHGFVDRSDFTDLSKGKADSEEIALVLRAINTERNNLVKWYGLKVDAYDALGAAERPAFYADRPWTIDQSWADQLAALNRFEARLVGCECCFNNADDFEHYHSAVCDPDFQEIEIIPDTTNVFARHAEINYSAFDRPEPTLRDDR